MHGFEKSLLCVRERRKSIFVIPIDNRRARTDIFDLTMQKISPDILMINWHKSYQIIYLFCKMRGKNKVSLAVELSRTR